MADVSFPTSNGVYTIGAGVLQRAITKITSSLDGDDITITFSEDVDNDGSIENVDTVTLSGGNEQFAVPNLELSQGNELYWRAEATDADGNVTTAANQLEITAQY